MDSHVFCSSDYDLFILASALALQVEYNNFEDIIFVTQDQNTYNIIDTLYLFPRELLKIIIEYCTHKIICKINKVTMNTNKKYIDNTIDISICMYNNVRYHYYLSMHTTEYVPTIQYFFKKYYMRPTEDIDTWIRNMRKMNCQYDPSNKKISTFMQEDANEFLNKLTSDYDFMVCVDIIKYIFDVIYAHSEKNNKH